MPRLRRLPAPLSSGPHRRKRHPRQRGGRPGHPEGSQPHRCGNGCSLFRRAPGSFHGSFPDVNVYIWSFCLSFKSATKFTAACARGSWFWATGKVLFEATRSTTTKKRAFIFSSAVILWSGGSTRSQGFDFIPRLVSGKFLFTAEVLSD